MTIPIQIWIPFLWTSPLDATFARDFQGAQREWRGEQYVWLDPDVSEVRRWMQREEGGLPEYACLVPSESLHGLRPRRSINCVAAVILTISSMLRCL